MSLLFESIRVSQGRLINLPYHQDRVKRSQAILFPGSTPTLLKEHIHLSKRFPKGEYKCRVRYGTAIEDVQFSPYLPKKISSLKLIYHDDIDYRFKYEDRQLIQELWSQKGTCDDILIVKQGYLSDTSYSNIVFWDGYKWITPNTYLLPGTQRARLIAEGIIEQAEVKPSDLVHFQYAKLINAMLDWKSTPPIPVKAIC